MKAKLHTDPNIEFITLSISLTTKCNFSCPFCFIPKNELKQDTIIPIQNIVETIQILREEYHGCLFNINLYGGELFLLDEKLLREYIDYIYNLPDLEEMIIITNTSLPLPKFLRSNYKDDKFRLSCSYYPHNKKFYRYLEEYCYFFGKNRMSISCLPYKDNDIIANLSSRVSVPIGIVPCVINSGTNDLKNLIIPGIEKYLTDKEFLNKTDSHHHSYIMKPGYFLLGEQSQDIRFHTIQEVVKYRKTVINTTPKCKSCAVRGTCPSLPVCFFNKEDK